MLSPAFSESAEMTRAEALVARERFVAALNKQIDKPYEEGAAGPESYDNAGLICYGASIAVAGTVIEQKSKLPKSVKAIYNEVKIIPDDKKEMGDLVFFKSKGGAISIIGVFLGGDTFIAALSQADGGEDCVSVFSLADDEWKSKYTAAGQFLPSGKEQPAVDEANNSAEETDSKSKSSTKSLKNSSDDNKKGGSVKDNIVFDVSAFFDWSLLSPRQFIFKFRGIDVLLDVSYTGWVLEPGFGVAFRYNHGLGVFQIPITFSMKMNDFIRVYAGPVVTFGSATLIDTDKHIKGSVFPGVVGVSFITPSYKIGAFEIKGVQDISYTVYNNMDGASLSFMESVAAGLVMYTGVRVRFPLQIRQ